MATYKPSELPEILDDTLERGSRSRTIGVLLSHRLSARIETFLQESDKTIPQEQTGKFLSGEPQEIKALTAPKGLSARCYFIATALNVFSVNIGVNLWPIYSAFPLFKIRCAAVTLIIKG